MILICYGTRPELIKVQPIIDEMNNRKIEHKVLFTGQHEDLAIGSHDYAITITDGANRLDSIIQSMMNIYVWKDITYTLVQGDTTTALALALASNNRQIPVIHLEAGLRTFDKKNPYPEESNRVMISAIADIHLCPTAGNYNNLLDTKTEGDKFLTGNTVLDSIDAEPSELCELLQTNVLVTLHRRENIPDIIYWFTALNQIAEKYDILQFTIPLHPNPLIQKYKYLLKSNNINIIPPVSRNELIEYIKNSKLVISDSGGIQEECSFLNKKVLVCRKITERPESVGITSFMCKDPNNLMNLFGEHIDTGTLHGEPCPYGDGNASRKIVNILEKL